MLKVSRWSTGWLLILLAGTVWQSLPGVVQAQRPGRGRPRFFQALKDYDESGHLARAVFRKGVTVLIEEHAQDDLIVVATHVRVGRLNASPQLCRIAAEAAERVLAQGVHDAGGFVQVRVGDRITSLEATVPTLGLRDAVRAHLSLFHLGDDEWELDRSFVESHVDRSKDVFGSFPDRLERLLGGGPSPGGAGRTGDEKALTKEALDRFLSEHYVPSEAVLTAVGTVRREQLLAILAEEMQNFRVPAARSKKENSPKPKAEGTSEPASGATQAEGLRYAQERAAVSQPEVFVGFHVPGGGGTGLAADLLRYVVAEGNASLLELPRQDEKEAPAIVRSAFDPLLGERLLVFRLDPTETLEKAEVRLLGVFEALSSAEVPKRLLNRAKAMWIADWYRSLQSSSARGRGLARAHLAGDYRSRDRLPDRIASITGKDVLELVRRYCTRSKAALIEVLPSDFEPRNFTPDSFRETLDILVPADVEQEQAFLDAVEAMGEVSDFEAPTFSPSFSDLPPRRSSVLRGPEIHLREDHRQPLVHVGLFFSGGVLSEGPDKAGLTRLLAAALLENLKRADGGRMLLALESGGARIRTVTQYDFFGIEAMALTPAFNDLFLGLVDWLHGELDLTEPDVQAAARRLARREDGAETRFVALGLKRLFESHPYGHGIEQGPASFPLEQVVGWKKSLIERTHPTIVVSGDVSGTAFLEGLVSKLSNPRYVDGKLPGTRVTYPMKLPIREGDANRAVLLFEGPRAGSVEVAMLGVGRQLLGGPTGRVSRRLRREGLGYRGTLGLLDLVRGGAVWLSVDAVAGKSEQATALAFEEARGMTERTVPPFDFRAAQVATITAWLIRQRDPSAYLCDTMEAALAGEPADYGTRYILNLRSLRMGEVEQALRRYVGEVQ